MLRLVSNSDVRVASLLQRVTLCGIDHDLMSYIERRLRSRWPEVVVLRVACAENAAARPTDLCICGTEPLTSPQVPTLWLGDVDRNAGVYRMGEQLWKINTPISGRRLVRALEQIIAHI